MKKIPYCVPEILEAVLSTAKNVSNEIFIHKKVLNTVIDEIASLEELGDSQYELMRICLRSAYKAIGARDPYEEKKQRFNAEVFSLSNLFNEYISTFEDKIEAEINIAAALNYKGICTCSLKGRCIEKRVSRLLNSDPIKKENIEEFRLKIKNASSIIYIVASAGEIVGDKILIQSLSENYKLTVAVAPHPILCRATGKDAEECGLDQYAVVVDPGVDMYGINLEKASSEFREVFKSSDVVIIKGGVNARTLSNCGRDYFVLGAGFVQGDDDDSEIGSESTIIRKYLKYVEA